VEEAPGREFQKGDVVATCMGGLGRDFDGGYAEYACVPAANIQSVKASLPWQILGALPEMLQTAYGALFTSLKLQKTDSLLIRGGTTSVGLAAASIAKNFGISKIAATSRRSNRDALLKSAGADQVFVDDGAISAAVLNATGGFDKVLELVGMTTLLDSLQCAKTNGVVCMTGIVGNSWTLKDFSPMEAIPSGVYLTGYSGSPVHFMAMPFAELVEQVAAGQLKVPLGPTFTLDQIVEAHQCMDADAAGGKIVVLT